MLLLRYTVYLCYFILGGINVKRFDFLKGQGQVRFNILELGAQISCFAMFMSHYDQQYLLVIRKPLCPKQMLVPRGDSGLNHNIYK